MGGAYGKGFAMAIIQWAKSHPKESKGLNIAVYDFAPFQQNQMKAVDGVTTYQFDNYGDLVVGYDLFGGSIFKKEEGVEKRNIEPGGSHSIFDFLDRINQLGTGHYIVENGKIIRTN